MTRATWLAAAALLALACADLRPIEESVCGNGVVDEGEDCDPHGDPTCGAADDVVAACRFLCSADIALECPHAGYGCGNDGVCRQASGVFEPMASFVVPAEQITTGDVDGDGNVDIIGIGSAGVAGVHGDADGVFTDEISLPINFTGQPDIGDVNGDERLDIVAPYELGILVFNGDESRQLASSPFASFSLPDLDGGVRIAVVGTGAEELPFEPTVVAEAYMCFTNGCDNPVIGATPLPPGFQARDIAGDIAVGNIPTVSGDADEMALVFGGDDRAFFYQQEDVGGGVRRWNLRQTVQLPDTVLFGARIADVNNDGFPDLMVSVAGGAGEVSDRVAVALWQPFAGTFDTAFIDATFDLFMLSCSVGTRWPIAAGNFDGDFFTDYVGNAGVCRGQLVGFEVVAQPSIELFWNEATIDDFNADDNLDVAAAFEGADSIDVFLGTGAGVFNRFTIDTDAPPFFLRAGDFNGDFVRDLAYIEGGTGSQHMTVAWGQREGAPHSPTLMASFGEVEFVGVLPFVIPGLVSTLDAIDDSVVISRVPTAGAGKEYDITILMGSSSEQMISPYILGDGDEGGGEGGKIPFLTKVGQFAGDEHADIFAIGLQVPTGDPDAPPPGTLSIHLLVGSAQGFRPSAVRMMEYPAMAPFAEGCSMVTSGDVDGDGFTEIVAVDNAFVPPEAEAVCAFDPDYQPGGTHRMAVAGISEDDPPDPQMTVETLAGDYPRVRHLFLEDFDMDGRDELVVVYGEDASDAVVVIYWNGASGFDTTGTEVEMEGALDAAVLNFDGDAERELAVLTLQGVHVFELEAESRTLSLRSDLEEPPVFLDRVSETDSRLLAADVTGDGLDDLLVTRGAQVFGFRAIDPTRDAVIVGEE